jgi:hypothetical protein
MPRDGVPSAAQGRLALVAIKWNLAAFRIAALLLLICVLTTLGCGQNPSGVIDPVKNVGSIISQLKQLFPAANPDTKSALDRLASSLKDRDYEGMVAGIKMLGSTPGLTFDQSQYLNRLQLGVESRVAEEMDHGNTNAAKAAQDLKHGH